MISKIAGRVRSSRRRAPASGALALAALALACWPFVAARAGTEEGLVSWYGTRFHDRPTASGELFDSRALTMAHPTLPFGTRVKVTNLRNGRSVIVRVNDRGPQVAERIADLSLAAAQRLGMLRRGLVRARLEVLPAGGSN
jgi:rare lipoprotein A